MSYTYELPDGKKFYIDEYLSRNLMLFVNKIKKDMDFVIVVAGTGQVRVGKSVLAQQIGAFLTNEVSKQLKIPYSFNCADNFAFTGRELIEKAKKLGAKQAYGGVIIYDEAGGELQSMKRWTPETRALIDFFRECGQLNLFVVLVLPDFFDLPKGIAVARTRALINVKFDDNLDRGLFSCYNWYQKKLLYLKGKKLLDYSSAKPNFHGRFTNKYTVDEQEYRKYKQESLKRNIKDFFTPNKQFDAIHLPIYRKQLGFVINLLKSKGVKDKDLRKMMIDAGIPAISSDKLVKLKRL